VICSGREAVTEGDVVLAAGRDVVFVAERDVVVAPGTDVCPTVGVGNVTASSPLHAVSASSEQIANDAQRRAPLLGFTASGPFAVRATRSRSSVPPAGATRPSGTRE
jgi:hypothetical protein